MDIDWECLGLSNTFKVELPKFGSILELLSKRNFNLSEDLM